MRPVEVDILITGFICRSLIFIRMADCDDVSDSPLDFFIRMADCDDVSDSPLDFFIRIADCDDVSDSPLR